MTTEADAALADLRAIHKELNPHCNIDHWHPSDDVLALAVLLRRQKRLTIFPAAHGNGVPPAITAKPTRKR